MIHTISAGINFLLRRNLRSLGKLIVASGVLPVLAFAQIGNSQPDTQRPRIDENNSPARSVPMAAMVFHVPQAEIEQYQYHVATILNDVIVSSGARPDESGLIIENVPTALELPPADLVIPTLPAQTILGARNRESNEWYFQIHLLAADLKPFVSALAVTMRQSRSDYDPRLRSEPPAWNGPILRYDAKIPADKTITIHGDRLTINETFDMVLAETGCRIFMEQDTVVISECQ